MILLLFLCFLCASEGLPRNIFNVGNNKFQIKQDVADNDDDAAIRGTYSWISPEGLEFFISYVADEKGFRILNSNAIPVSASGVKVDGNQGDLFKADYFESDEDYDYDYDYDGILDSREFDDLYESDEYGDYDRASREGFFDRKSIERHNSKEYFDSRERDGKPDSFERFDSHESRVKDGKHDSFERVDSHESRVKDVKHHSFERFDSHESRVKDGKHDSFERFDSRESRVKDGKHDSVERHDFDRSYENFSDEYYYYDY